MEVVYVADTPRLTVSLKKTFTFGKPWAPPIQKFNEEGILLVDTDRTEYAKEIVKLLDDDFRYGKEFRRQSDVEKNVLAVVNNEGVAYMPAEGISEDLKVQITYLIETSNKNEWKPAQKDKVWRTLGDVTEAFQMHGVRPPLKADTERRMKSLILEILDILETSEIYPEKE